MPPPPQSAAMDVASGEISVPENSVSEISASQERKPLITATDGECLMHYRRAGDQSAFEMVVDRHADMVWRVCWSVLNHTQDVEDAFQATFLILANRGHAIRANDSAAGWLYRVAHRTALARRRLKKQRKETSLPNDPLVSEEEAFPNLAARHAVRVLMEELRGLPDRYQTPLVLRYLEGKSRRAIANQTDVTVAAVQGQLVRGKRLLRQRLAKRGVSLTATMGVIGLAASSANAEGVPSHLSTSVAGQAEAFSTAGKLSAATQLLTPAAASLTHQGIRAMLLQVAIKPLVIAGALALTLCVSVAVVSGDPIAGKAPAGSAAGHAIAEAGQADAHTLTLDASPPAELVDETAPAPEVSVASKPRLTVTGQAVTIKSTKQGLGTLQVTGNAQLVVAANDKQAEQAAAIARQQSNAAKLLAEKAQAEQDRAREAKRAAIEALDEAQARADNEKAKRQEQRALLAKQQEQAIKQEQAILDAKLEYWMMKAEALQRKAEAKDLERDIVIEHGKQGELADAKLQAQLLQAEAIDLRAERALTDANMLEIIRDRDRLQHKRDTLSKSSNERAAVEQSKANTAAMQGLVVKLEKQLANTLTQQAKLKEQVKALQEQLEKRSELKPSFNRPVRSRNDETNYFEYNQPTDYHNQRNPANRTPISPPSNNLLQSNNRLGPPVLTRNPGSVQWPVTSRNTLQQVDAVNRKKAKLKERKAAIEAAIKLLRPLGTISGFGGGGFGDPEAETDEHRQKVDKKILVLEQELRQIILQEALVVLEGTEPVPVPTGNPGPTYTPSSQPVPQYRPAVRNRVQDPEQNPRSRSGGYGMGIGRGRGGFGGASLSETEGFSRGNDARQIELQGFGGGYGGGRPPFDEGVKQPGKIVWNDVPGMKREFSVDVPEGGYHVVYDEQPNDDGTINAMIEYGDGKPDGKKSLGGSSHTIRYSIPTAVKQLLGVRIHGSRYGAKKPPKEDFTVTLFDEDFKEITVQKFPYSSFQRGDQDWVTLLLDEPVTPVRRQPFYINVNFNPGRTKGVYVSYDNATVGGGQNSYAGTPSDRGDPTLFESDWMIQPILRWPVLQEPVAAE